MRWNGCYTYINVRTTSCSTIFSHGKSGYYYTCESENDWTLHSQAAFLFAFSSCKYNHISLSLMCAYIIYPYILRNLCTSSSYFTVVCKHWALMFAWIISHCPTIFYGQLEDVQFCLCNLKPYWENLEFLSYKSVLYIRTNIRNKAQIGWQSPRCQLLYQLCVPVQSRVPAHWCQKSAPKTFTLHALSGAFEA